MNIRKPRRAVRRLGVVAALALALGTVTAAPALAHARLIDSTPGKGASAESVTEIKLVFSDKISLAKVVVTDAQKKTYQSGEAERSGTTVTQKLAGPLPAGSYTVAYRVVGEDGHPIENADLTFTATGGEAAAPAPSAGAVGAEEQAGTAATTDEQPLKTDQEAEKKDSGSGAVLWVLIVAGLMVGIGFGMGIVYRAKRKHRAATGSE
ncbi:copper resistance CopC family protein [Actinomadura bangladeshensis]|uniref:Copper resistance protein CopC n=1 Tax=Actinomadura bangladeshensis TaxID=453573 RepID=A0A6L9QLQ5_9ACTN|nr:copper resistance protein CopC [Actinomadura bangladeshensis]NEA26295.1 copper resistance protein CopC [Actinomadura bangladeshensis]